MADPNVWANLIRQIAPKYGVDPNAALAVASMEGMSGRVGDGGHAFGPFQLNDAGGVLTNMPGNHRAFAESPQGIEWALQKMGGVARGLQGPAAVNAIVSRFERPANPGAEIQGANSHLANAAWGPGGSQTGGKAGQGQSGLPPLPSPQGGNGGSTGAAMSLLQMAQQGNGGITPQGLLQLAMSRQQGTAANQQFGSAPAANRITQVAQSFLGTPYQWGGSTKAGMDCSAFIQNTYAKLGVKLPRTTFEQAKMGAPVDLHNLQPGDAIFTEPGKIGPKHVGMYIGNGQVQESPHTGDVNKVIPLQSFLSGGFVAARRYLNS